MKKIQVNKGDRFGRLQVIREVESIDKARRFECRCDCGNIKIYRLSNLRHSMVFSCGCYHKERLTTHGQSGTLEYIRNGSLKRYGITTEIYNALLAKQNGSCEICGNNNSGVKGRNMYVDHDHITGVVRGLLCHSCNLAVGYIKESSDLVLKLFDYLRKYGK